MIATELPVDPLAFQWHPEVWLLVAFVTVAYVYMVRVIGPKAVPAGQPVVSRANVITFVLAMITLWVASDWPMHDISEEYLYSVHMVQHMLLAYFLPPLALMATPTWLFRVLIGDGRIYRSVKWLAFPVVAGVIFNGVVMLLHAPLMVNASVENAALHYGLHVLVVTTSLLMWMPVCGPIPEFRIGVAGAMIYLFLQSVVPTVPAAWLTFAEGVVYDAYDKPIRLWGISAVDDQQIAGAS
jgi:putative membrane protein